VRDHLEKHDHVASPEVVHEEEEVCWDNVSSTVLEESLGLLVQHTRLPGEHEMVHKILMMLRNERWHKLVYG
jgi:hypothetical protein